MSRDGSLNDVYPQLTKASLLTHQLPSSLLSQFKYMLWVLNHCIVKIHFSCDCAFNVQTGLLGSTSQWLKPPRELSVCQSYQFNYILCWVHNLFFKLGTIADWTTPPWKMMRAKDCSGLSHKKLWHSWADLNVTAVSLFHSVFCLWCLYVLLCYMPIYFAVYS